MHAGDGRDVWTATMRGDDLAARSSMGDDTSLVDGLVCVTRIDRIVYAVEQATGAAAWTYQSTAAVTGGVVSDGSLAYVGTLDGQVHALRLPDREPGTRAGS